MNSLPAFYGTSMLYSYAWSLRSQKKALDALALECRGNRTWDICKSSEGS